MDEVEVKNETTETPKTQLEIEVETVTKAVGEGKVALPPKFKSVDEWVKSYTELQTKFTQTTQENAELKNKVAGDKKPPASTKPPGNMAEAFADEAAPTTTVWDAADKELNEKGELSEETKASLTQQNIPQTVIDSFVSGYKAKAAAAITAAQTEVGGEKEFTALTTWVKKNYSAADREVIRAEMSGPGWKLALRGLHSLYKESLVKEPSNAEFEQGTGNSAVKPYTNQKEMAKDIADPRYQVTRDPEFVKTVEARLRATALAGRAK